MSDYDALRQMQARHARLQRQALQDHTSKLISMVGDATGWELIDDYGNVWLRPDGVLMVHPTRKGWVPMDEIPEEVQAKVDSLRMHVVNDDGERFEV